MSSEDRPRLLVVCGKNKKRSRTAEHIYKNDMRFDIKSVGLSPKSERQIKATDVQWADAIVVMEDEQKRRIKSDFRSLAIPPVEVLHIPDIYEYMDAELVELLQSGIEALLSQ